MRLDPVAQYMLFGGGRLLCETAELLLTTGHAVTVVTSPRQVDQALLDRTDTLRAYLRTRGIEPLVLNDLEGETIDRVSATPRTLGLSFGAAWIFRPAFIERWGGRLLNVHGARLPHDRGSGGFSWQILRGNRLGCCVIHQIDTGVDTGPVLRSEEFVYSPACRIPLDFQRVYLERNVEFLRVFLRDVEAGVEFPADVQSEHLSTYWPRLSTEHHGYIDWNWTAGDIERFICAFDEPYRGASAFVGARRIFVKSPMITQADGVFHPFQAGLVYRRSRSGVFVSATEGSLLIGSVTDEMGQDILGTIKLGDRFWTPAHLLDKARQFRATYTGDGLRPPASEAS